VYVERPILVDRTLVEIAADTLLWRISVTAACVVGGTRLRQLGARQFR
jgi:hypothetical protein